MPHRHLTPRLLERLLRGEVGPGEVRELALHLVETCPDCGEAAGLDWAFGAHRGAPEAAEAPSAAPHLAEAIDDDLIDRVRRRMQPAMSQVLREREQAPALLAELQGHPPERQRILLRNKPRFHTLPLAELLIESAWQRGFEEPEEAEEIAALALELVDLVDGALFGEEMLNDVRGRAWGVRANCLRILSRLREADEAFARADALLGRGTGDLLERARFLSLKSTLRRLQMRLEEGGELIDQAVRIYRALDETHLAGRAMVSQAIGFSEQGEPGRALERLKEAQALIDPERDPYLMRIVQQNLVVYLSDLGQYEDAMSLVPALRTRVVEDGTRIELLRLRWQEGKILLGLGHEARAEAAFLEVRKGFIEQGIGHDVAAVSLELAALYLRQGRSSEIRELAAQMLPLFQSRDLRQEAVAALLLFQRAVEMETLTLRMIEEVADVLRRSHDRPRPRTEEPS